MRVEKLPEVPSGRWLVPMWLSVILVLSGAVSGVAWGHETTITTPAVTATVKADLPSEFGDVAIDEFARNQPFRVECDYSGLAGEEYDVRVLTDPEAFIVREDRGSSFANTVSGEDGTRGFTVEVDPSDSFDTDEVSVWCELHRYEQVAVAGAASSAETQSDEPVASSASKTLAMKPTTVYVRPLEAERVTERDEMQVEYYGWTTASARAVLYVEGTDGRDGVGSGSLDGTRKSMSFVPSAHLDLREDRKLPLELVTRVGSFTTIGGPEDTSRWKGSIRIDTFPRVTLVPPTGGYSVGTELTFSADAVDYDSAPGIDEYEWTFSDGKREFGTAVTRTFDTAGTYRVDLTVTDDDGLVNTTSLSFDVGNEVPTIESILVVPGTEVPVGEPVDLTATARDPEGVETELVYTWDFDDGASAEGRKVTHRYELPGTYTVELTVSERGGDRLSATTSRTIRVTNEAPTVEIELSTDDEVGVGEAIRLEAVAEDREHQGELVYEWEFDDGTPGSDDPEVTLGFDEVGRYRITVTVSDPLGRSATDTVVLDVVNRAPDVGDIAVSPGTKVLVDERIALTAPASDPEGSALTYNWRLGNGDVGHSEEITHVYEGPGTYEVTLTVSDELGEQTVRRTNITVLNEEPEFVDDPDWNRPSGVAEAVAGKTVSFRTRAEDPDGGPVRYQWTIDGSSTLGDGEVFEHVFERAGTFEVTVRAVDDEQSFTEKEVLITVRRPSIPERIAELTLEESIAVAGLLFGVLTWLFRGRIGGLIAPLRERLGPLAKATEKRSREGRRPD